MNGQSNQSKSTYRNPWHKANGAQGPEFYTTDARPVQIGKYTRYHRIAAREPGRNCYDFVLNGVCFAQRCGPATEAQIDADEFAQDNLRKLGFVS